MQRFNTRIHQMGLAVLLVGVLLWSITYALAQTVTVSGSGLQGYVGDAYTAQFSGAGGVAPYTFSFSGTLPPGTTALTGSGQITGFPTQSGQYPVTVTARDANNVASAPTNFTLCIGILVNPATLLPIVATKPYTATISTSCALAPVTYTITAGSLPAGLSLDTNTGVISGTTTFTGTVSFTVTATDANGKTGSRDYNVNAANPVLSYSPNALPNGFVSTPYSATITIGNGTLPYTVTQLGTSSLPAGFTFSQTSTTSFRLSGTTTQSGNFTLNVQVVDANGVTETRSFGFSINVPDLTLDPTTLPNATVGVPYSQQITAAGGTGPYQFNVIITRQGVGTVTDSGLNITPVTSTNGITFIDGVPRIAGQYSLTVSVTDSSTPQRSGSRVYSLQVVGGANPVYNSVPNPGGLISFGLVSTPGAEVSQRLTIINNGTATLNVCNPVTTCSPLFSGLNAGDFRLSIQPPFIIGAGGTASLDVICRPGNTLFASSATLTFRTNDPNRSVVTYTLLCNQLAPTATPGVGTPTAIAGGTAGPSILVLSRATAVVTDVPDTFATVTFVKGLALRSGPYLGATMLGIIRPKKDYGVLAMNPGDGNGDFNWYLVVDQDNNRIGWASGRYLILKGDPNIPLTPTVFDQIDNAKDFGVRVTIFGNVNIRARPSERMPVLHTTAYGTELEVLGRTYQAGMVQWIQVRFYDPSTGRPVVGWVYYRFDAPELIKLKGIVPLDAVPIR